MSRNFSLTKLPPILRGTICIHLPPQSFELFFELISDQNCQETLSLEAEPPWGSQVHFLPYGAEEPRWLMGFSDAELHERPVPGFLCFRSWDITRKVLLKNVASQRARDFLDKDDQKLTVEVWWCEGFWIRLVDLKRWCNSSKEFPFREI